MGDFIKGGRNMNGKLNINYQVNTGSETTNEACNIDVYFNCINEKTFDNLKGTLKESCTAFGKLISQSNIDG